MTAQTLEAINFVSSHEELVSNSQFGALVVHYAQFAPQEPLPHLDTPDTLPKHEDDPLF